MKVGKSGGGEAMYSGTLIDDLIKAVQQVEAEVQPRLAEPQRQPGMIELQLFMSQMQHMQNARPVRVGMA
jgi:hypothetical protein